MEYREIKQLMDDMGESKLNEIAIEFTDGTKIKIKKDTEVSRNNAMPIIESIPVQQVVTQKIVEQKEKDKNEEGKYITSPMVGTFYAKPSPSEKPFVELGTKVKKGQKLCIIEAMKLMNEIEAEWDGEIAEVLVKDGEVVDYGKKLFRIV